MLATQDVHTVVRERVLRLLAEEGAPRDRITGTEPLSELGVGSLMLARLLVELEGELDVDPFAEDADLSDVRTVDQLVAVYQRALA